MIENIINKYKDVELIGYSGGDGKINIILYDLYNKGVNFESDIKSIVEEFKKIFYRVDWEVYNPKEKDEDDGYETAFIDIIE